MLEAEGLVYAQANRMVRITATSLSDLEEIYAARIVLEAAGVSLTVPKLTAPDLEELARSLASLDVASSARDLESWEASHRLFHHLMRQYAGRRMDAIAQGLSDECGRYRRLYLSDDGARIAGASREHHEILDAAVQRNASLASRLIARHLGRTALTDAASLAPERDPALVREALRFALGTVPSADARSDG
jgi:DNA-binding GntR family transcriptional regulator